MAGHEHFEELSALAAIGELSAEELASLHEHVAHCESCRAASTEFATLVHEELPLAHRKSTFSLDVLRAGKYRRRFLESARARGFQFSQTAPAVRFEHALIAMLLVVSIAATTVALLFKARLDRKDEHPTVVAVTAPTQKPEPPKTIAPVDRSHPARLAELEKELAAAKLELKEALERASNAERTFQEHDAETQSWKATLEAESAKSADLSAKMESESRRVTALNDDLQRAESGHRADEVMLAAQQKRVDDLLQQVRAQADILNGERQLLSAGRDVRDLMGARNLHIIDVFDTDQRGNNRKAFGRVFYTEGKSLIFYAFDFDQKMVDAKFSFQAWGTRDGGNAQAKSLGIFYVDDKSQKRWVLKSEDPVLLSQIDSVFVTLEPAGGVKQPSGQKLLYAFLKNQANHP